MRRAMAGVLGTNVLAKGASVVAFMLLTQAMPKADYARYSLAYSIYGLVSGFVFAALNFDMVRAAARARAATGQRPWRELASYGLLQALAFAGVLLLVLLLAQPLAEALYRDATHRAELIWGVSCTAGIILSNYVLYVLQAEENYHTYNTLNLIRHLLLLPLFGLAWALGALDWAGAMAVFLLANLLPAVVYLLRPAQRRLLRLSDADPALMRGALRGTFWMMLYFTCASAVDHLGVSLLQQASSTTAFITESTVADYGAALRFYHVEILTLFSVNAVLLPRFARADERVAVLRGFMRQWWLWLTPGFAVIAGVLWLGLPVWTLLTGAAYASAYPLFCVMTFGAWAYLLFLPALNMLLARGRYIAIALCAAGTMLLFLGLGPLIIARWGVMGLAMLSAVGVPLIPLVMTVVLWFERDGAPAGDPPPALISDPIDSL